MRSASNLACAETDIRAITEALAANAATTDKTASFPRDNVKLLASRKLLGLFVPEHLGGLGGSAHTFAEMAHAIGEACASTGMIFVMHSVAVQTMVRHYAHAEGVLSAVAQRVHLSTLACSERGTGANFYASFARSSDDGNEYVLNGEKCFVTSGGYADSYLVSTQAVGSESPTNTALYLVPRGSEGLSFTGTWTGLGLRGNSSVQMNLENCRLPKTALVGDQGQGLEIEMGTILPFFLLGTAAVYNGVTAASLKSVIKHASSRTHAHTGEPISAQPMIRSKVAEMKIQLESSCKYLESAVASMDLVDLLSAKQLACTTAVKVTNMAMEIAGGIAYSGVLPVERHFRDAQAGVVMAPTNAMLLDLVGRAALGLPLM